MSTLRIALILDVNKDYDRKVAAGIARYLDGRRRDRWSIYLEDEPAQRLPKFRSWHGDGVIANLDDTRIAAALRHAAVPVVGVGGGYGGRHLLPRAPYIFTDNAGIARLATAHLLDCACPNFAYCGYRADTANGWSKERGEAFASILQSSRTACSVFAGSRGDPRDWDGMLDEIRKWLGTLTPPIGLFAADDVRARHVLEACRISGLRVPTDVAVVGVDNDPLMCSFANPPLSSVIQDAEGVGWEAAKTLDMLLRGQKAPASRVIPPVGLEARASTAVFHSVDPLIAAAVTFIHNRVLDRIQVSDVAKHVGVSVSTLEGRFRKILGKTVHKEILGSQLERAEHLLRTGDLPVADVARESGFASVQYFCRLFHQRKGCPPGRFRQRHGVGVGP